MNGDCRKNETFMTHCVKDRLSSMDDNFIPIMSSIDDEISIFATFSNKVECFSLTLHYLCITYESIYKNINHWVGLHSGNRDAGLRRFTRTKAYRRQQNASYVYALDWRPHRISVENIDDMESVIARNGLYSERVLVYFATSESEATLLKSSLRKAPHRDTFSKNIQQTTART